MRAASAEGVAVVCVGVTGVVAGKDDTGINSNRVVIVVFSSIDSSSTSMTFIPRVSSISPSIPRGNRLLAIEIVFLPARYLSTSS